MSVAERYEPSSHDPFPVTAEAARWVAELSAEDITDAAFERAKHVLLDWMGCSIAGAREPLVGVLLEELGGETQGPCTLIASGQRARLHERGPHKWRGGACARL